MKSILITGGSGLVGGNVAEFFRNKGYLVYTADLKEKDSENHIVCDLSKEEDVKDLPEKIDYILHFAAYVDEKDLDKVYLLRNNILSTINVLEYATKVEAKKIVYSSSSAVYGQVEKYPIEEGFGKNPTSIYGISKYFGEELCNLYRRKGLSIVTFRLGYVLAPIIPKRYFIYRLMEKISKNEPIKIINGDKNSMSFIDVKDIAEFCEESLEKDTEGNFNLTGQREVTSREVIKLLLRQFENYSGNINEEENEEAMKNSFSNEKLYSAFAKRYGHPIEESIKEIASEFKKQNFNQE